MWKRPQQLIGQFKRTTTAIARVLTFDSAGPRFELGGRKPEDDTVASQYGHTPRVVLWPRQGRKPDERRQQSGICHDMRKIALRSIRPIIRLFETASLTRGICAGVFSGMVAVRHGRAAVNPWRWPTVQTATVMRRLWFWPWMGRRGRRVPLPRRLVN